METTNPTMANAAIKMDDLRKRDDFEQSKSEMLDKRSAEVKPESPTVTSHIEALIPESINTEVRDSKIGLIKMFIQLALDGQMDYEEVVERLDQVRGNNFISADDASSLKKELDVAFGKTPEQIHDAKLGLIQLFIKMAKENQMDYEEVLERIQQVRDNNFISEGDKTQLIHELDETLGKTPEQIRTSKLGLANLFISLYEKGQMDKDEVSDHIGTMLENGHILKDDADSLLLKIEAVKPA